MKGSIPIPYIIALLLGIGVVAILGYWFFVVGGQWTGTATETSCRDKAIVYCTKWQLNGYGTTATGLPDLPPGDEDGWFGDYAPECAAFMEKLGFTNSDSDIDSVNCQTKILAPV